MTPQELRDALEELGLNQSEAARRLGVEQSTMYRWVSGERKVPSSVEAALEAWRWLKGRTIEYSGFEIIARPYQLATGQWAMETHIRRNNVVRAYFASNKFDKWDEATAHCLHFGKRIIDGEIPEFSGSDLP